MLIIINQLLLVDIDECETESDPCPSSAYCNNTYGSYLCICTNGTKMDDKGDCTGIQLSIIIILFIIMMKLIRL